PESIRFRYGSFGGLLEPSGQPSNEESCTTAACLMPYRFTGQRLDPETSLYYFKNRYYDTEAGRFMTRDPANYVDGANIYAYANNAPPAATDPFGLTVVPEMARSYEASERQSLKTMEGREAQNRKDHQDAAERSQAHQD